jgi:hypothetical protein
MSRIHGMDKVLATITDRERGMRRGAFARAEVGYSAPYAVYVHENLQAYHPVGQAKYLERPAREYAGEIARITREALQKGMSLKEALLEGGRFLLRMSQPLVPVDTGALRASGFVRVS